MTYLLVVVTFVVGAFAWLKIVESRKTRRRVEGTGSERQRLRKKPNKGRSKKR